jgi:AcrR family transcriptional regulator
MGNVMSIAKPATRRKNPAERQAEIVAAASRIAVSEGLERVTAKRVAAELGVVPGLVNHYFAAVDDLVAASFGFAAEAERAQVYGAAWLASRPKDQLRRLLAELLDPARDAVSLLWLDAWQGSRRRPALLREVVAQMEADAQELARLIQGGVDASEFHVEDAREAALGIMALIDGLSVQAATRTQIDYVSVSRLVIRTTEAELGLAAGSLEAATAS